MPYNLPEVQFDAVGEARKKIEQANGFQLHVVSQFIATYEEFWGLNPGGANDPGGSRYSTMEMQAILDAMPMATAIDILQDASEFKTFVNSAYPGQLPAKYHESAWDYVVGQDGITLTALKDVWKKAE